MGGKYSSESTASGYERTKNRKNGFAEWEEVSFDISNIHVVVAERCCKGGYLTSPTKIRNIMIR